MNTLPRLWVILERRADFPNATWYNSGYIYSSLDRAEQSDAIGRSSHIEYSIQECAISLPNDDAIDIYSSLTFFAIVHQYQEYPTGWRVYSPTFSDEQDARDYKLQLGLYALRVVKCVTGMPEGKS